MNTELTLNEYQGMAMTMCMRTSNNAMYMLGNLCAEIGEAWGKIAKAQRHGVITIDSNGKIYCVDGKLDEYAILMAEVKMELGDVAWQLAGTCSVFGWSLDEVCQANLQKLQSRKQRGVIDGSGDNR